MALVLPAQPLALAPNVQRMPRGTSYKSVEIIRIRIPFFKMKRSTPSSFKQPPRKKQKTQSDEIAVLKRKVNKINRAIEVKWYETSRFQPMAYVTSNGVDLALYQRSLVDMGAGDSLSLQEKGRRLGTPKDQTQLHLLASSTTNRTYSSPMLHC